MYPFISFWIVGWSWESFQSPQWWFGNIQALTQWTEWLIDRRFVFNQYEFPNKHAVLTLYKCFFDLEVSHLCVRVRRRISSKLSWSAIMDQQAGVSTSTLGYVTQAKTWSHCPQIIPLHYYTLWDDTVSPLGGSTSSNATVNLRGNLQQHSSHSLTLSSYKTVFSSLNTCKTHWKLLLISSSLTLWIYYSSCSFSFSPFLSLSHSHTHLMTEGIRAVCSRLRESTLIFTCLFSCASCTVRLPYSLSPADLCGHCLMVYSPTLRGN